jgi:predicted nucleic acid-binding protein
LKIFLDTSVLVKKYIVAERGGAYLAELLTKATIVAVSPVTWIETHHVLYRTQKEGLLDMPGLEAILKDLYADYMFFHVTAFNNALEEKAIEILRKIPLKSQDVIQLASAVITEADLFCTADQKLFQTAKEYIRKVELISSA